MAIIGVFGYAGSGKDTVGKLLQIITPHIPEGYTIEELITFYHTQHEWWLEDRSGWEIKKWAGKLKAVASLLTGIPQEKFEDQEFKKTNLGPEWSTWESYESDAPWIAEGEKAEIPMTVRDLLQKLGTDAMRNGLHPNSWVNALMSDYIGFYDMDTDRTIYPNWIITDTRFPNEAKAIKDKGGIVIKVERPGVGPVNDHPSEIALKDYEFDYIINNDGSLEDLLTEIKKFVKSSVFTSL